MTKEQIIEKLDKMTNLERAIVLRVLLARMLRKFNNFHSGIFVEATLTLAHDIEKTIELEELKGGSDVR